MLPLLASRGVGKKEYGEDSREQMSTVLITRSIATNRQAGLSKLQVRLEYAEVSKLDFPVFMEPCRFDRLNLHEMNESILGLR